MAATTIEGPRNSADRHVHKEHSSFDDAMYVLEKISFVALAIFTGYMVPPELFFPFMGAGVLVGIYVEYNKPINDCDHCHGDAGGCSQGFLEQGSGVRLPAPIGLVANLALTAAHVEHLPDVFGPLIGFFAGMLIGKCLVHGLPMAYRRVEHLFCSAAAA